MTDQKWIRRQLEDWAEPEYRRFCASLLPNVQQNRILGVRLPKLRRLAKGIAKDDWRAYLNGEAEDNSFEEVMLQGMVIGYAKADAGEILEWVSWFLTKIDNWSVCDSFCSGLKIAKEEPEAVWAYLRPLFGEEREYTVRFAAVMFLNYFCREPYLQEGLSCLERVRAEAYYVRMVVAWAVSVCFFSYREETFAFLETCRLDEETWQKSLQKILESRQVDPKDKERIRSLKKSGRLEKQITET